MPAPPATGRRHPRRPADYKGLSRMPATRPISPPPCGPPSPPRQTRAAQSHALPPAPRLGLHPAHGLSTSHPAGHPTHSRWYRNPTASCRRVRRPRSAAQPFPARQSGGARRTLTLLAARAAQQDDGEYIVRADRARCRHWSISGPALASLVHCRAMCQSVPARGSAANARASLRWWSYSPCARDESSMRTRSACGCCCEKRNAQCRASRAVQASVRIRSPEPE